MTSATTPDSQTKAIPKGYILGKELARGAFAVVHRGENAAGEPVAIKVLASERPQARERFLREIKVNQNLPQNDYVVRYLDEGELEDGTPFMVMELIDGFTLGTVVSKGRALASDGACDLMIQLCDAFGDLHKLGVTHGDIKPENILLDRQTRGPKLLDFGLVRDAQGLLKLMEEESMIAGSEFEENLDVGMIAGTPDYIAPETIADAAVGAGGQKTDTPADVFGLGVIFYELLMMKRPWPFKPDAKDADAYREQAREYLDSRVTAHPNDVKADAIPFPLWTVIAKALHPNPKMRQRNAAELGDDIKRYVKSGAGVPTDIDYSETPEVYLPDLDPGGEGAPGSGELDIVDTRRTDEKARPKAKNPVPAPATMGSGELELVDFEDEEPSAWDALIGVALIATALGGSAAMVLF